MDTWRPPAPALTWLLDMQYPSTQPPLHRALHPGVEEQSVLTPLPQNQQLSGEGLEEL